MPISRALLNRLRLPYKALDIQGSKGDVLYIPDDVGVDLSVIHGVHNGDMVPVKTDTDGVVSVAVDSALGHNTPKTINNDSDVITARHIYGDFTHDTSAFINYRLEFIILTNDVVGSDLTITVSNLHNSYTLDTLGTDTIPITNGGFITIDLTEHKDTVSLSKILIAYQTSVVDTIAGFALYALGWN